jgi:stage V sporulation protein AE
VDLAGNGVTVPLPGFGYNLAKGAMEGAKDGFLGVVQGAVRATSAGITIAVVWGYLLALLFNPKPPR